MNKTHKNTPRIAKFEKVPYEQFKTDLLNVFYNKDKTESKQYRLRASLNPIDLENEEYIRQIYDTIKLPKRGTKGAMGYDFFAPFKFELKPEQTILVPTGIRVLLDYGWGMVGAPRSGHGFKYRIQLDNTIGIIDADYSESSNYGHIMFKLTCDSKSYCMLQIQSGDAFAQGLFIPHGLTIDDDCEIQRDGGFGSTDKKQFKTPTIEEIRK